MIVVSGELMKDLWSIDWSYDDFDTNITLCIRLRLDLISVSDLIYIIKLLMLCW